MSKKPLLQLSPGRRRAIEIQINRGFSEQDARQIVSLPAAVRNKIQPPNRLTLAEKRQISRAFRGLPVKEKKTLQEEIDEAKKEVKRDKNKWELAFEKVFKGKNFIVKYKTYKMVADLTSTTKWIDNVKWLLSHPKMLYSSFRLVVSASLTLEHKVKVEPDEGTNHENVAPDAQHNIDRIQNWVAAKVQSARKFNEFVYFLLETRSKAIPI